MTGNAYTDNYLEEVVNSQVDLPLALLAAQLFFLLIFTSEFLKVADSWVVGSWSAFCFTSFIAPYVIRNFDWWRKGSLDGRLSCVIVLALMHGLAIGSLVLYFPLLDIQFVTIITLVLLGFVSGSAIVTRGHQKLTFAFSMPVTLSLVVGWALLVNFELEKNMSIYIGVFVILFLVCHMVVARSIQLNALELHHRKNNQILIAEKLSNANGELEQALEKEKLANETKVNFIAQASHDLRQPIHSLSLFNAALSMQELDESAAIIVGRMDSAISHLAEQMDLMLDISKLDAGLLEAQNRTFDLAELVKVLGSQYSVRAQDKSLQFNCSHPKNTALVNTDRQHLSRVIENVLSNAIRYTDAGSVSMDLDDSMPTSYSLTITDTGIGIDPNKIDRIFDEFYQVQNSARNRGKGLGLGLSIVKRLCRFLEIEFTVKSQTSCGTCFTLKLRKGEGVNLIGSPMPEVVESDICGLTILCVDDEKEVLDAMKELLEHYQCRVFSATDINAGVAIVGKQKIDMLISDFRLTEGQDGIDMIRLARNIKNNLPAILISGDTSPARLKQAAAADITILHKPVKGDQLKKAISSELKKNA